MRLKVALPMVAAGLALVALGLYLAPSDAFPLQEAHREHGKPSTGVVGGKRIEIVEYDGGGRRARPISHQERIVDVLVPGQRTVSIDRLVLSSDYERLQPGDRVNLSLLMGDEALRVLPHGPYYLLKSSVEASSWQLLGWAFSGRPASGKAIAAGIPGVILLLIGGALVYESTRRRT